MLVEPPVKLLLGNVLDSDIHAENVLPVLRYEVEVGGIHRIGTDHYLHILERTDTELVLCPLNEILCLFGIVAVEHPVRSHFPVTASGKPCSRRYYTVCSLYIVAQLISKLLPVDRERNCFPKRCTRKITVLVVENEPERCSALARDIVLLCAVRTAECREALYLVVLEAVADVLFIVLDSEAQIRRYHLIVKVGVDIVAAHIEDIVVTVGIEHPLAHIERAVRHHRLVIESVCALGRVEELLVARVRRCSREQIQELR